MGTFKHKMTFTTIVIGRKHDQLGKRVMNFIFDQMFIMFQMYLFQIHPICLVNNLGSLCMSLKLYFLMEQHAHGWSKKFSLIVFSHTHERNVKKENIPVRYKSLACPLHMLHNEQVEEEEPGPESEGRGRASPREVPIQWGPRGNGHGQWSHETIPPTSPCGQNGGQTWLKTLPSHNLIARW